MCGRRLSARGYVRAGRKRTNAPWQASTTAAPPTRGTGRAASGSRRARWSMSFTWTRPMAPTKSSTRDGTGSRTAGRSDLKGVGLLATRKMTSADHHRRIGQFIRVSPMLGEMRGELLRDGCNRLDHAAREIADSKIVFHRFADFGPSGGADLGVD